MDNKVYRDYIIFLFNMSQFNDIEYQNFDDLNDKNQTPKFRKLKIIKKNIRDRSNLLEDDEDLDNCDENTNLLDDQLTSNNLTSNNLASNNLTSKNDDFINHINNDFNNKELDNGSYNGLDQDSMKTVDLNSTNPYGFRRTENRYYDSLTNTSFNDIEEFNRLNDIKFNGKKDSLIMEVEDTKNILRNNLQKVNDRSNIIAELDEKSSHVLENSNKFKNSGNKLKQRMIFNYICHIASLVLTIIIVVTFVLILVKH